MDKKKRAGQVYDKAVTDAALDGRGPVEAYAHRQGGTVIYKVKDDKTITILDSAINPGWRLESDCVSVRIVPGELAPIKRIRDYENKAATLRDFKTYKKRGGNQENFCTDRLMAPRTLQNWIKEFREAGLFDGL